MSDVPGWSFTVSEKSPGYYCAKGIGPRRMSAEYHSTDHEEALERVKAYAAELMARVEKPK